MGNTIPHHDYYVYYLNRLPKPDTPQHLLNQDGTVTFYVGKGRRGRILAHEACARRQTSCHHRTCRVIRLEWAKDRFITRTKIAENLTEPEAHEIEIEHIAQLRAMNFPLVNLTDGGEGTSGKYSSQISKDLWQTPQYRNNLIKIRNSHETKIRMSKAASQRNPNRIGMFDGFIDPSGKIYTPVMNLQAFCREHGLSYCSMWLIDQDKQVSSQGWTRYNPPERNVPVRPIKERKSIKGHTFNARIHLGFVSPNGTIYKDIYNLKAFCQEHDLQNSLMSQVEHGKIRSHKGWTRYNPDNPTQSPLF